MKSPDASIHKSCNDSGMRYLQHQAATYLESDADDKRVEDGIVLHEKQGPPEIAVQHQVWGSKLSGSFVKVEVWMGKAEVGSQIKLSQQG